MKVKTLSAFAGLAGTTLIASTASADFTGIEIRGAGTGFDLGVDHNNAAVRADWLAQGGAYDAYRIYATFDSSGDAVQAVFGDTGRRAFLSVTGGSIRNHVYGTAPYDYIYNIPTFSFPSQAGDPGRGWDTFVSIGRFVGDSETSLSPGFGAATNDLNNNWDTDIDGDLSWFVAGEPAQAVVGASNDLLLMQLVVTAGSLIDGNFGVQTRDQGAIHDDVGEGGLSHFAVIPTPGALALLGLAGLTGTRRRRRA